MQICFICPLEPLLSFAPTQTLCLRAQQETSIVIWLSESAAENKVVKKEARLPGISDVGEDVGCVSDRGQRESPVALF